jgi:hypothetical protein
MWIYSIRKKNLIVFEKGFLVYLYLCGRIHKNA